MIVLIHIVDPTVPKIPMYTLPLCQDSELVIDRAVGKRLSLATSFLLPIPRQPVCAPFFWVVVLGNSDKILAMKAGSVRGVISSYLGRR